VADRSSLSTAAAGPQQALVRLWSNPVPLAHRDWWAACPAGLVAQASAVPAARRGLVRWLRERVPLPALHSFDGIDGAPWALGSARGVFRAADRAGLLLMRGWIAKAVTRKDLQAVLGFLGNEHYEAALRPTAALWHDVHARPNPAYDTQATPLQRIFRDLGFHALNQALAGRKTPLWCRMRLLAGPQAAQPAFEQRLPIDDDGLLRLLQGDAGEQVTA
jgi:hypothetical protein